MMPNNKSKRNSNPRKRRPQGRGKARGSMMPRDTGIPRETVRFRRTNVTIPRGIQFFPDRYKCYCRNVITVANSGATSYTHAFTINSPAWHIGPAAASNVPSGMSYLLSTAGTNNAPYTEYVVLSVKASLQVGIQEISAANQPSAAFVTLVPTSSPALIAATPAYLKEQPGAAQVVYSAGSPATMATVQFRISELAGVSEQQVMNDPQYATTAGAFPNQVFMLFGVISSIDGQNVTFSCEYTFEFEIVFKTRGDFTDTVPTLSKDEYLCPSPSESQSSQTSHQINYGREIPQFIPNPHLKSNSHKK